MNTILRHLYWLGADRAPITDRPGLIGLEVHTRPDLWEQVWSVAIQDGSTIWVATYNTTYPSVSINDLRMTA